MRRRGIEPPRPFGRQHLKLLRLPFRHLRVHVEPAKQVESHMAYRKWTDRQLKIAVETSFTKSAVLRKLGLVSTNSGNFQSVDSHIMRMGIDTSHFHSVRSPLGPKRSLEEILKKGTRCPAGLGKRLVKEGLFLYLCKECGINKWLGKKISLQLDHEDGDRTNNLINNLRLLCPNCHSQTPTYSKVKRKRKPSTCACGNKTSGPRASLCIGCEKIRRLGTNPKANWPPVRDLLVMVKELGLRGTGAALGVSDSAVKKHIRKHSNLPSVPQVGVEPTPPVFQTGASTQLASGA